MWVLAGTGWLGCDSRRACGVTPRWTPLTPPPRWGSHADSRQELWSVQPYSSIPCWAQARAYSRSTGQGHSSPWSHVHSILSHRATKGSGSTRGWQRANTEALFRSWHCSHRPCRRERPPQRGHHPRSLASPDLGA